MQMQMHQALEQQPRHFLTKVFAVVGWSPVVDPVRLQPLHQSYVPEGMVFVMVPVVGEGMGETQILRSEAGRTTTSAVLFGDEGFSFFMLSISEINN